MQALIRLSRLIDGMTAGLGRLLSWAIVAAVIISAANAIIRKAFDTSSNAWLEVQWWLFGLAFLLCSPWTLASNEHIRIDIVNNLMPNWMKQAIEVVGHALFLLPVAAVMVWTSIPFFMNALPTKAEAATAIASFGSKPFAQAWVELWSIGEGSGNFGGLVQWPAKLLLPVGFSLLFLQGVSELIKRIAIIRGDLSDETAGGGHHASAEAEAKRLQEAIEEEARKRLQIHTRQ